MMANGFLLPLANLARRLLVDGGTVDHHVHWTEEVAARAMSLVSTLF
jgi:hypothetical protein